MRLNMPRFSQNNYFKELFLAKETVCKKTEQVWTFYAHLTIK